MHRVNHLNNLLIWHACTAQLSSSASLLESALCLQLHIEASGVLCLSVELDCVLTLPGCLALVRVLCRRAPASSSVEAAQLAEPASMSNPVELPEAVLTRILQHIPLWERFDSCPLVSQQWAAAAAAATTDIDTVIEDYEKHGVKAGKCDRMSAWLKQHGAHVTSIKLENSFGHSCDDVLVFPCEKLLNLQRLVLHGFEVQLETADSAAAATAGSAAAAAAGGGGREGAAAPDCHKHSVQDAQQGQRSRSCSSSKGSAAKGGAAAAAVLLPRLQELQLVHCELAAGTLELLPSLPSLSKLLFTDSRKDGISTALPQLLHQLPALQDLQFVCAGVPERGLDPVSTLQRLQRLSLAVPYGQDLGVLARMPAGLTGLVLTADPFYKPAEGEELEWIGLVQLPLLQGLTALRHLEIKVRDCPHFHCCQVDACCILDSITVIKVMWQRGGLSSLLCAVRCTDAPCQMTHQQATLTQLLLTGHLCCVVCLLCWSSVLRYLPHAAGSVDSAQQAAHARPVCHDTPTG